MKHTVIGASGDIGSLLVNELISKGHDVSGIVRNINNKHTIPFIEADAEDITSLIQATKDTDVLYSTIAVPYITAQWQQSWPIIMRNLIEAAKTNGFKLVFLDNIYMYGQVEGEMTENTPFNPVSKKGVVRAQIARELEEQMNAGTVNAVIGRSADFYGPSTRISSRFFQDAYNNATASWMGDPDVLRTFCYTLDNAKALALLGSDQRADRQVWHLPAAPAMRGRDFIALASKILGKELETMAIPGPEASSRRAFFDAAPEIAEMMYQYEEPYIFSSKKFEETFGLKPTSYEEGFRHVFATLGA